MFKKHKFKILAALIVLLLAGGGVAFYMKKKADAKKKEAEEAEQGTPVEEKEPFLNSAPLTKEEQSEAKQEAIKKNSTASTTKTATITTLTPSRQ